MLSFCRTKKIIFFQKQSMLLTLASTTGLRTNITNSNRVWYGPTTISRILSAIWEQISACLKWKDFKTSKVSLSDHLPDLFELFFHPYRSPFILSRRLRVKKKFEPLDNLVECNTLHVQNQNFHFWFEKCELDRNIFGGRFIY